MRWLKHLTAAREDEKIAQLITKYGHAGYGLWWLVCEVVAQQLEGDNPEVTYPVTTWSHLLSVRGSHVRHCLSKLAVTGLVTVEWIGTDIKVRIPNLLKYRDEYSRKSGHSPDTVRSKTHIQKQNIEAEAEAHTQRARAPTVADQTEPPSARFSEFIAPWPRKVGLDEAARAWLSVVPATIEDTAFAARDRYLASDEVSRGVVMGPAKWIYAQARDGFNGSWPLRSTAVAVGMNGNGRRRRSTAEVIAERISKGEKPW